MKLNPVQLVNQVDKVLIFFLIFISCSLFPIMRLDFYSANILIPGVFIYFLARLFFSNVQTPKGELFGIFAFFAFFIWGVVSCFFADDYEVAIDAQKRVLITLIFCAAIVFYMILNKGSYRAIFSAYLVSFAALFFDFIRNEASLNISQNIRDEFSLNANAYGYFAFFALVSSLSFVPKSKILGIFNLSLLSALSFYILIAVASRGGAAIYALLFVLSLILIFVPNKKIRTSQIIIAVFGSVSIVFITYSFLYEYVEQSYLYTRFMNQSLADSYRVAHLQDSFLVGFHNPVFGVGGGNYAIQPRSYEPGSFSHNGFGEAFASYGLPGLLIYLSLFFWLLKSTYLLFVANKDGAFNKPLIYSLIFIVGFVVYNFLYVPYLSIEFMGILFAQRSYSIYMKSKK